MKNLFHPIKVKNLLFKNRLIMPALASFLFDDEGNITDAIVEHYRRRANSGVSMLIVEACAVSPEGIVSPHQGRIFDDRYIDGFSRLAAAIRERGAIAGIQIHHSGRQTSPRVINQNPVAPSPLPCPTIKGDVMPLTKEEIREIVRKFGDAAERAVKAGFDLIEIHGAHGYLINQFLSGFSNIRDDEYGGSVENRTRFAKEVVEEIRGRIGDEFPLSFKISAQEFVPNGLTTEESIEIIKILIDAGIDLVQVSAGCDATPEWICQPMYMKEACLVDSAARIKNAVNIPVMAVGRINDPVLAEEIISKGFADFVCMGRAILADPELPKKAEAGRLDEINMCIACNTCMESIFRKGRIECLVNPFLGREKDLVFHPAKDKKKIMVVGGGPAGMNVAWIAAKRGHKVKLFEKSPFLGGQLVLGSTTTYKKGIRNLINFQENQVKRYGVECVLGKEVTPETIKLEDPDVVILATGSYPIIPNIPGVDKEIVVPVSDILLQNGVMPKESIVVGGGPTGCEVALHLAESGSKVTIVEMLSRIGNGLESITRKVLLNKLKQNNVIFMTDSMLKRVEDNGVVIKNKDREIFLSAERVILSIGSRPDTRLYEQIKDEGYEIHQIGDCLEPRSAKTAIYEGTVLGLSL